jgi:cobalt-zinc-cadmium efflux system outer membrane protein
MKKYLGAFVLMLLGAMAVGQPKPAAVELKLSLKQYLAAVAKGNLSYAAQQYNVGIAEAELRASKVFPDPEISISYSNNQDNTLMMGQGIETGISYPISFGNKRGASIALAQSTYEQSQSALDAFYFSLRADATLAYLNAVHNQEVLLLQKDSYQQLQKLADADSIRLTVGEIMEIDAQQSALEAKAQQGQLFQAQDDWKASCVALTRLLGASVSDTSIIPLSDGTMWKRTYILNDLIQQALALRPDLKVAAQEQDVAKAKLRQLKADRAFEFSLDAGYSHNTQVRNETAPAPAFSSYSAGITIPLKLSNINRSAVRSAKLSIAQSEVTFRDMQQQVVAEIATAYAAYRTAQSQLEHYSSGIVDRAEKILQGRIYAYQRGQSTLMEVLGAQRSYNDIRMGYADSRLRYATTLVELERVAGIWDIE